VRAELDCVAENGISNLRLQRLDLYFTGHQDFLKKTNSHKETEMANDIEVKELPSEALTTGEVLQVKHESLQDTLWLADNIEKLVDANKKIFTYILKSTHPGDFVAFGKGANEKIEIIGAGCERIGRDVGVSFANWTEKMETFQDDIGPGYRYIYEADAIFRSRIIRVMSLASSRTKFFGKDSGEYKDLSEVSREDVQIAAKRGIFKEGVKVLLGLRHLSRSELEKYGVKVSVSGGYNFQSKEEKSADITTVTDEIVDAKLSKETKDWTLFKIKTKSGLEVGTFSKTDYQTACDAWDKKLQATISYKVTPKGNKEITAISLTDKAVA